MAILTVSTDELPEPSSLGPVPQGEYICEIVYSDVTETATSQGRRVLLTFEVIEGDYVGYKIWERCDIDRVSISKRDGSELRIDAGRFNGLLKALQVGVLNETTELHGLPVVVRVVVEQSEGYAPKNIIKGYRSARQMQAEAPAKTAPARPAAAAAQQPTRGQTVQPAGNRPVPAFMQNRR